MSPSEFRRGVWVHAAWFKGQEPGRKPPLLPSPCILLAQELAKATSPHAWEVMLGLLGPSLQIRLVALPEMTSFVRQISLLGSFLISDVSDTETLPTPRALRKLSCIASLCSMLCLFIIHGIMFVL